MKVEKKKNKQLQSQQFNLLTHPYLIILGLTFLFTAFWIKGRIFDGLYYKEALGLFGVGVGILLMLAKSFRQKDWSFPGVHWILIFACPIILSLPGLILHAAEFNSNFCREIVLYMVTMGIALLVFKSAKDGGMDKILNLVSFALIVAFIGVFFEQVFKISFHMSATNIPSRGAFTFGNPNYFSGFLAIALPLVIFNGPLKLLFMLMNKEEIAKNRHLQLLTVASIAGVGALFLTPSLGSLFAVGVSTATGLLLSTFTFERNLWKNKFTYITLAFLLLFGLVIEGASGFKLSKRISGFFTGNHTSLNERLGAWQVAKESLKDSPWLGFGAGSSYDLFFRYRHPDYSLQSTENIFSHTHNELLELTQECGYPGAFLLLCLGLFLFFKLLKGAYVHRKSPEVYSLLATAMALLAYFLDGLVSLGPRIIVIKLILGVVMGMYLALDEKLKLLPVNFYFRQKTGLITATLFFIVSSLLFVPRLQAILKFDSFYYLGRKATASELRNYFEYFEKRTLIIGMVQVINESQNIDVSSIPGYIERLEKIVKNYVGVPPILAAVKLRQSKYEEAWDIVSTYAMKDPYHTFNNHLAMKLSVARNNLESFVKTLEREIIKLARHNQFSDKTKGSDYQVRMEKVPGLILIDCKDERGKTVCTLSERVIRKTFELMRSPDPKAREELKNLIHRLYSEELKIGQFMEKKKMRREEFESFRKNISDYFKIQESREKLKSDYGQKVQRNYYTGNVMTRPFEQFKDTEELKKQIAEQDKKIKDLELILSKDIDIASLSKRKKFVLSVVNFIISKTTL
jgi:O-antigen ligase